MLLFCSGKFNLLRFYFQKIGRFIPMVTYFMIVGQSVFEYMIQNFPYALPSGLARSCKKHWLSTLMHVQNLTNPEEMVRIFIKFVANRLKVFFFQCLPWTWFLAVTWHGFLLTPVLLLAVLKFGKKILLAILSALFTISVWNAYNVALEKKLMLHKLTM